MPFLLVLEAASTGTDILLWLDFTEAAAPAAAPQGFAGAHVFEAFVEPPPEPRTVLFEAAGGAGGATRGESLSGAGGGDEPPAGLEDAPAPGTDASGKPTLGTATRGTATRGPCCTCRRDSVFRD